MFEIKQTRALGAALLALLVSAPPVLAQQSAAPGASHGVAAENFHAPDAQLRELIATLLDESPRLDSAWARSRSGYEMVPQARSLPDPQLSYRYFAMNPETRVGPQEHMLELMQGVPWGGKRQLQAQRAERMATGTTWEAEDLARALVAQLKRAYFEAAYLQEALTVNAEEQELLRRFESIALRRYATGEGIQQTVLKVQTDISRLVDRHNALHLRLNAVSRRIAELIGRPATPLPLERITLPLPGPLIDRDDLESFAEASHSRVRAAEQRIEADRLWEQRRQLETRPNFRFGLGYTLVDEREDPAGVMNPPQDNGMDVLALTVGIDVPLYRKRIRAGVAEARESRRSAEGQLEAVKNQLRYEIQEGLLRFDTAGERGRLYRDVIIPQAEESLASSEAAYTTNRQGFLDLLDAERILFEARLSFHRQVADAWTALADLERAAGKPVTGNEGSSR